MKTPKVYRSQDGRHYFSFVFEDAGRHIDIRCTRHPALNGRDGNVHKTHLYGSGLVCFVAGREPKSLAEAESRAAEWAEYYLNYIRTGIAQ